MIPQGALREGRSPRATSTRHLRRASASERTSTTKPDVDSIGAMRSVSPGLPSKRKSTRKNTNTLAAVTMDLGTPNLQGHRMKRIVRG